MNRDLTDILLDRADQFKKDIDWVQNSPNSVELDNLIEIVTTGREVKLNPTLSYLENIQKLRAEYCSGELENLNKVANYMEVCVLLKIAHDRWLKLYSKRSC